jgi:uracil-DNA glycosylase
MSASLATNLQRLRVNFVPVNSSPLMTKYEQENDRPRGRREVDDGSHATLVWRLAEATIGDTFNQYAASSRLCARLEQYLAARADAPLLLVGEAAGYRGARVSGIPFTSERQLTGTGPAEATATIVRGALQQFEIEAEVLLWNVVPTHPGTATSNRVPTREEIESGLRFAQELARGRRVLAVGRVAKGALGGTYIRHPSHGGARAFRETLRTCLS